MKEQNAAHSFEKFEGYTPGPWKIADENGVGIERTCSAYGKYGCLVTDSGGKYGEIIICDVIAVTSEVNSQMANANLIASAPDMLAELTRLRSELQQKDEVIKDFIKLQNEMLERVIEYEGGVTEFAKGKTEAYRYTAKKMNDLFVWHDFKKIDL